MNEAIVLHAALSYLTALEPHCDPRLCQAVGIRMDQLERLNSMNGSTLMEMASKGAGCIKVEIDADAFDELMADADEKSQRTDLIHEFILHDASRPMMTYLFDMSQRDYARARSHYGVERTTGRPRELTTEEAHAVFDSWQEAGGNADPKTLLAVAKQLDLPLRLIWDELSQNYHADGGSLSWA